MNLQRTFEVALIAGAIVGILDIGMAALINLVSPLIVLKAIASGLAGEPAFSGGTGTVILGLLLQILMSVLIAVIYIIIAQRLRGFSHPWVWGAIYGCAVFFVMNWIVVPLSAYPYSPKIAPYWVLANLATMVVFGTIIALVARRLVQGANAS